jgi:hypothetical protein
MNWLTWRSSRPSLAGRGLEVELCIPAGQLAFPAVCNSRMSVLAEKDYSQADAYWFAWVEKIVGCDGVTRTADVLGRAGHPEWLIW